MTLSIDITTTHDSQIPTYAHEQDAGADLRADHHMRIPADGGRRMIRTGVSIALPDGYAAFIHPRSGLAERHGVTVLNAPGTIDAGYRGEIAVCLINHGDIPFHILPGDRIAQLVIQKVEHATFVPVHALDSTTRGVGGFGSTGVK